MKKFDFVLIIEDDEITSILIEIELKKHLKPGTIMKFPNAEVALQFLETAIAAKAPLPDLILLDINLPVMNGWEFLEHLGVIPKESDIPVVLVSSSIDVSDLEKAGKFKKVRGFINKPFKMEKLAQISF